MKKYKKEKNIYFFKFISNNKYFYIQAQKKLLNILNRNKLIIIPHLHN